jgi:hypothetical protein
VDDGFHCTPLVPGCLKALQYVLPCAVGAAQCYLSNEVNSFACAAQYDGRGRADTQLRIDWKVRHGPLTPQLRPEFHTPHELATKPLLDQSCCRSLPRSKPRLEVKGAARSHSQAIPPETIKLAVILNHMPLDTNQWVMG